MQIMKRSKTKRGVGEREQTANETAPPGRTNFENEWLERQPIISQTPADLPSLARH